MSESMRDLLYSTQQMTDTFSPKAHMQAMLSFEAALARAEADAGIIPSEAATSIAEKCHAELFDVAGLYREAVDAGTPAIPLVRALTSLVQGDAQKFVHWGATSQDAIDTALMLQMRDGLLLLEEGLLHVCASCATLVEQHRETLMVGRTLLQQALPVTFGLKVAQWLALTTRQVNAIRVRREHSLAIQLGGAAGTLASLGQNGMRVVELLAQNLQLPIPDLPWHTERDRIVEIGSTTGIVAGTMAKIAEDIVLLAQTEVGEVSEGTASGKGVSSAMPQKHNPVDAISALAAARLAIGVVPILLSAMTQEHERAAGAWQAEWMALPELFCFTASAVERVGRAVSNLHVDPTRMRANLDLTHGLVMAESLTMTLAQHIGKSEAHRLVQRACERVVLSGESLQQVALKDAQICQFLSPHVIEQSLNPIHYRGSTGEFIHRALEAYREAKPLNHNQ